MRFYKWVGISLLVHAVAAAPLALTTLRVEPPPRVAPLDMELFGMVSDRQQEEKVMAGEPAPPAPPTPEAPAAEAEPPQPAAPPEEPQEPLPESAAVEPAPEPAPAPVVAAPAPAVAEVALPAVASNAAAGTGAGGGASVPLVTSATGTGTGGGGGADAVNQQATSLGRGRRGGGDELSAYTAMVARRLQANLIYPEDMRKKGIEAVVTIAFTVTENGRIKGNSVEVRKGSGYSSLDERAVKSARSSAPFAKPPRELKLVIEVAFNVETFRRRR
ncbi:MAG: TonB family protein [Acidobacteriota bacterium]|jgi:protein TonB|nr:TonB family protein [Acidobacteriota bacterium]